jgi:molecular chaperone DnaK
MVYNAEKTIKEHGDKVSAQDRESIESSIAALKESMNGDDIPKIKSDMEKLSEEVQKVGTAIYQKVAAEQAQKQAADQGPPPEEGQQGKEYVDADYKIMDEDEDNK